MLQLAQFIARYGVVMGKAMWEASKKGIALFKKSKESNPEDYKINVADGGRGRMASGGIVGILKL